MIDWIVAIVSLFALVFIVLWFLAPGFRARVEQPKFDMLARASRRNRHYTNESDQCG
jgi:hypothetical protein